MANPANNPLFKHFRQPSIYLRLPSRGSFYPDDAIDFPAIGEIPIYPMTVKDELTLKTPDALLNGQGMVDVVASCCPNIKNPWLIPAIDVDSLFIAIRLASYGEGMDISTKCPHCGTSNEHTVDLRALLDNVKYADYSKTYTIDNLSFKFKPQTYADINKTNIITFEEQRLINSILTNDQLTDEDKAARFKESFAKLNEMNINAVLASIDSITTEDGITVTNEKQIVEFLENCSREAYAAVKTAIQELVEMNKPDPISVECDECHKPYTSQLIFDQSNFFG